MSGRFVAFPAGLVGGDGRRLRIGSHVSFVHDGLAVQGEVVGWAGPRRGVEVHLDVEPYFAAVPAVTLTRVDEPLSSPVTVGWTVIDDVDATVLLIVPLGGRDMQWISDAETAERDGFPTSHASTARTQPNIRAWAEAVRAFLAGRDAAEEVELVARHVDFPMLRRVLDESSLPPAVKRLVFVVTDQDPPQSGDTVDVAEVARTWLRQRGHLDDAETAIERPVLDLAEPIVIRRQPHLLDAVYHQIGAHITQLGADCDRVASVVAGGTPAITYGLLLAASTAFGPDAVTSIQPPHDLIVEGRAVEQPLIELRLFESILAPETD